LRNLIIITILIRIKMISLIDSDRFLLVI